MGKVLKCCGILAVGLLLCVNAAYAITLATGVSGTVSDDFRKVPVSGATVVFKPISLSALTYTVTTNSAGAYAIPNLIWYVENRVGYKITVSAPGYQDFTSPTVYFNGKANRYNAALKSTAAAELKGAVTDQTGKKLAGITVVLKPTADGAGVKDYTAVTDADGKYSLTDVLAYVLENNAPKWIAYKLSVTAAGYKDYTSGVLDFKAKPGLVQNVVLAYAGQNYEGYVDQVIYSQDAVATGYNERYMLVKNTGEAIGLIGIDRSNSHLVPLLQIAFQTRCKVIFTAGRIDKDAIYDVSYLELNDERTGLNRVESNLGTTRD